MRKRRAWLGSITGSNIKILGVNRIFETAAAKYSYLTRSMPLREERSSTSTVIAFTRLEFTLIWVVVPLTCCHMVRQHEPIPGWKRSSLTFESLETGGFRISDKKFVALAPLQKIESSISSVKPISGPNGLRLLQSEPVRLKIDCSYEVSALSASNLHLLREKK